MPRRQDADRDGVAVFGLVWRGLGSVARSGAPRDLASCGIYKLTYLRHVIWGGFVMHTVIRLLSLSGSFAILAGCTTYLDAKRVTNSADIPPAGAPYYLPFTQYSIVVTRRLVCGTTDDGSTIRPMGVMVRAEFTRSEVRDPARNYVIDLDALQSAFKSTDVNVTYFETGALKSVNATAEDRTGSVVVSTVTSLGKIVMAVSGQAYATTVGGPKKPSCRPTFVLTIDGIKTMEAEIKAQTAKVRRLEEELASLTAVGQTLGKAWDTEERKAHAAKQKELFAANRALAEANDVLKADLAAVSIVSDPFSWPKDGDEQYSPSTASLVDDLTRGQLEKWGTFIHGGQESLINGSRVYARICSTSPVGRWSPCDSPPENGISAREREDREAKREEGLKGLKYRVPAEGRMELCTTPTCEDGSLISADAGVLSQLGPIFTLPLQSAVFTHKSIAAEFDAQGRPLVLGVMSKAAAENAAGTAAAVTDQVLKVREGLVMTKLERVKEETALLTAEKELASARAALVAPPTPTAQELAMAAFTADTAVLDAEIAYLKARAALEEAKRLVPAP